MPIHDSNGVVERDNKKLAIDPSGNLVSVPKGNKLANGWRDATEADVIEAEMKEAERKLKEAKS